MCVLAAPKAHDAAVMLFGAPKAQVMRYNCAECAQTLNAHVCLKKIKLANFFKYVESLSLVVFILFFINFPIQVLIYLYIYW